MKAHIFFVSAIFIFSGLWVSASIAFEIQYPGDAGFFIGKPMGYRITADANNPQNVGQEGIFTFGQDRITLDGKEYYDCVFKSPLGYSHFYLGIDSVNGKLMQKGFKIGSSELVLKPAVTAIRYPLAPGSSWTERNMELTAKDLEIPGLGRFPMPVPGTITKAETKATPVTISVPAGKFDTLLVEATFTGSLIVPMTLVQRTWVSEDNIIVKRNFEFTVPTKILLYEIELSSLTTTPWDVNWDKSVDILDAIIVAVNFGKQIAQPKIPNPDVDGNGVVDLLDLEKVVAHFGERYTL